MFAASPHAQAAIEVFSSGNKNNTLLNRARRGIVGSELESDSGGLRSKSPAVQDRPPLEPANKTRDTRRVHNLVITSGFLSGGYRLTSAFLVAGSKVERAYQKGILFFGRQFSKTCPAFQQATRHNQSVIFRLEAGLDRCAMNWYPARIERLREWGNRPLAGYGLWLALWDLAIDFKGLPKEKKAVAVLSGYTAKQIDSCWQQFLDCCVELENGRLLPREIYQHWLEGDCGGRDIPSWFRIRADILARDSRRCFYCGEQANSVDHLHPYSRGGTEAPSNLVAACQPCNSRKKDKTLPEYVAWLGSKNLLHLIAGGRVMEVGDVG